MRIPEKDIDEMVSIFKIKIDGVNEGFSMGKELKVYPVKSLSSPGVESYIFDAPEARGLACFPHIVGDTFIALNRKLSKKTAKAIINIAGLEEWIGYVVHVHVLRAGSGYMMSEALKHELGRIADIYIRPLYLKNRKKIEITYADFSQIPRGAGLAVIIPDTVATGFTLTKVLHRLAEEAHKVGSWIDTLIVYGFIADYGLERVSKEAKKLNISFTYFFALEDVAALAGNFYDMVLYGPDVSQESFKPLGAITHYNILKECINYYVPGLDQPGDWSNRQPKLFNGETWEKVNLLKHLTKSRKTVEVILKRYSTYPWFKRWHKRICKAQIKALKALEERF
ncbi:MAG TPA: hypothetical protein ENG10_00780 [Candidatus Bathyarchaeota archaeon]|nr:hypothetical protein [Candidatus Bathyarchaeota archaeon]HEX68816.1 hypothetical protein [Candidatus Bathyarchaeota archaeon]